MPPVTHRALRVPALALLSLLLVATGCASDEGTGAAVTYHRDVEPLLQKRCLGCHAKGGLAPFSFDTYAAASGASAMIANAVVNKTMPPWGAHDTDACTHARPFKDDGRLSEAEIKTLKDWHDLGAPKGETKDAPAKFVPSQNLLEGANVELKPAQGWVTEGKKDQFICFVLDPKFDTDVYVQASHVVPGNKLVAHHALVFTDGRARIGEENGKRYVLKKGAGTVSDTKNRVELDKHDAYPCFGNTGLDQETLLHTWTPGAVPDELPPNAGIRVKKGSLIVLQMHYHPLGAAADPDASTVQLKVVKEQPEFLAVAVLFGNASKQDKDTGDGLQPGADDDHCKVHGADPKTCKDKTGAAFVVPAGKAAHKELMQFTVPPAFDDGPFPGLFIYSVFNHMHYVGTDMRMSIHRKTGDPVCADDKLNPAVACVEKSCSGVELDKLETCVQQNCAVEVLSLPADCLTCMTQNIAGGVHVAAAACGKGVDPESVYGPLPKQSDSECLLQTPNWDFQWQRFYSYSGPITGLPMLGVGDKIVIECTYNNTLANRFVKEALDYLGLSEPQDVQLGDETLDEMCVGGMKLLYKPSK